MNSSRPPLLYLSTGRCLAQVSLIDSNLGGGQKFMGIVNDQQRELVGIVFLIRNIIPSKLIWYEVLYQGEVHRTFKMEM